MTLLTCSAVMRRLAAFYDRELPVGEMIAVESHVSGCPPCARELHTITEVGSLLRSGAVHGPSDDWTGLTPGVISRMRAEQHESLTSRVQDLFQDLHLVWIGLASTAGALLCGVIALGTVTYASPERNDSLSTMLVRMGAPWGSDLKPAPLDWRHTVPSVPQDGVVQATLERSVLQSNPTDPDDTMMTLSAVVSREGRVSDLAVLSRLQDPQQVSRILDAISQGRLQPAELGGSPVAVNLIWLLAQTTVRGKLQS